MTARFGEGGQLSGGTSIGRTVTDDCVVVDSPQDARDGFCRVDAALDGRNRRQVPRGVSVAVGHPDERDLSEQPWHSDPGATWS